MPIDSSHEDSLTLEDLERRFTTELEARAARTPLKLLAGVGAAGFALGLILPVRLQLYLAGVAASFGARRLAQKLPADFLARGLSKVAVPRARSRRAAQQQGAVR
jgi:hypothetical protein